MARLLDLPNEILVDIARFLPVSQKIHAKTDDIDTPRGSGQRSNSPTSGLTTLCCVNKHLNQIMSPLLYNRVHIESWPKKSFQRQLASLSLPNHRGIRLIRHLIIAGFCVSGFWSISYEKKQEEGSPPHVLDIVVDQLCAIFNQIDADQLISLDMDVIDEVNRCRKVELKRQGNLQNIRVSNLDTCEWPRSTLEALQLVEDAPENHIYGSQPTTRGLTSLTVTGISTKPGAFDTITKLLNLHAASLRELELEFLGISHTSDEEKTRLIDFFRQTKQFENDAKAPGGQFFPRQKLARLSRLHAISLHEIGDLNSVVEYVDEFASFESVKKITLVDCPYADEFLRTMTGLAVDSLTSLRLEATHGDNTSQVFSILPMLRRGLRSLHLTLPPKDEALPLSLFKPHMQTLQYLWIQSRYCVIQTDEDSDTDSDVDPDTDSDVEPDVDSNRDTIKFSYLPADADHTPFGQLDFALLPNLKGLAYKTAQRYFLLYTPHVQFLRILNSGAIPGAKVPGNICRNLIDQTRYMDASYRRQAFILGSTHYRMYDQAVMFEIRRNERPVSGFAVEQFTLREARYLYPDHAQIVNEDVRSRVIWEMR